MSFHAWCSRDRDYLLGEVSAFYGRTFSRPADAVRYCCAWLGFEVLLADWLPHGVRGEVCFESQHVYVNPFAYTGVDSRKNRSARRVTETIAHELAHIRLHEDEMRAGIFTQQQEEEAQQYARIFLVPRADYQEEAPWVAISDTVGAYRAAKRYDVTPGTAIVRAREICPPLKLAGVLPKVEIPEDEVSLDRLIQG